MNLLNQKTTWTNKELIPLKLCIGSAYLFLGMYFHEWVANYKIWVIAIFVITWIWVMYLWLSKLKSENQ